MSFFANHRSSLALVLFQFAWVLSASTPVVAQCPDLNLSPPFTLVLMDRSGSMSQQPGTWSAGPVDQDRTPWQAVRVRVEKLLEKLPSESVVRVGMFRDMGSTEENLHWSQDVVLSDAAERQRLLRSIDERAPTENQGKTPLFDAMLDTINQARLLSGEDPTRDIAIVVYTDGADTTEDENEKEEKRLAIGKSFAELVELNQNVWLYYTPIIDGQSITEVIEHPHAVEVGFRFPLPLQLDHNHFVLDNAKLNPESELTVSLCASDGVWPLLRGKTMSFEFVPDEGQPIRVEADPVRMTQGEIQIPLHVMNPGELKADVAYAGHLKINYPGLDDYELRAPTQMRLRFQAATRPEIVRLLPNDNATIATGVAHTFAAQTLQGASVLWDFGDGQSATGSDVRHTYSTAGERTVTVSVTGPNGLAAEPRTIRLNVVDLGVSIEPINPPVMAELELLLERATLGPIDRTTWLVDGRRYQPSDAETGTLRFTFLEPGKHVVEVIGFAEASENPIRSESHELDVRPPPKIELDPKTVRPGKPIKFTLESPQGWESIDWDFDDGVKVTDGGTELTHTFKIVKSHSVTVTMHWAGGRVTRHQRQVAVIARPIVPRIGLDSFWRPSTSRPDSLAMVSLWVTTTTFPGDTTTATRSSQPITRRFYRGDTLQLRDESTGDIQNRFWRIRRPDRKEWEQLSEGTKSVPLDEEGVWELALHLESYPDAKGQRQKVVAKEKLSVLPPPNWMLLWLAVALTVFLLAYAGYVLLYHNAARSWQYRYQFQRDIDGHHRGSLLPLEWDPFRKCATLDLSRFVSEGYWRSPEGKDKNAYVTYTRRNGVNESRVRYSGQTYHGFGSAKVSTLWKHDDEDAFHLIEPKCDPDTKDLFLRIKKGGGIWWRGLAWFLALLAAGCLFLIQMYRWTHHLA